MARSAPVAIHEDLLSLLADGCVHSGSELATKLGVTRAAVWKNIAQLKEFGLPVSAMAGKGYQLGAPVELLDRQAIEQHLTADIRAGCSSLDVMWQIESTSDYLLAAQSPANGRARACIAEFQTGGRGRRGRPWLAPPGYGLCLSLGWLFDTSPASLSCLGLAVGVGAMRALRNCGANNAELKWPNDVVVDGRKLAGVLIDVRGEAGGPLYAVAGVGANYQLDVAMVEAIRQSGGLEPASLTESAGGGLVGRNRAAAEMLTEVYLAVQQFQAEGFEPFAAEWRDADYLRGREVTVVGDHNDIHGTAQGICEDGRLRVQSGDTLHHVLTGDVSVRSAS